MTSGGCARRWTACARSWGPDVAGDLFARGELALIIAGLRMLQRRGVEQPELEILTDGDVDVERLDQDVDALIDRLQFGDMLRLKFTLRWSDGSRTEEVFQVPARTADPVDWWRRFGTGTLAQYADVVAATTSAEEDGA